MQDLYHLIYASEATQKFQNNEVFELLSQSRKKNAEISITGMLLHDQGSFFQVLEGKKDTVWELFSKISKDERHQNVVQIIFEAIPHRNFGNWSMGYSEITAEDLKELDGASDGFNDFFTDQLCLKDIDAGRASKLLQAFVNGRWRLQ